MNNLKISGINRLEIDSRPDSGDFVLRVHGKTGSSRDFAALRMSDFILAVKIGCENYLRIIEGDKK